MASLPTRTTRPIIFPLPFLTFNFLVILLAYLQLLYGTSFLLRPFWPSEYGPRPLNRILRPAEKRVLEIITDLIPPPFYRSPVPSGAFVNDELTFPHFMTVYHASQMGCGSVISAPPRVVELDNLPHVHSSTGRGQEPPGVLSENEIPDSTATHIGASPVIEEMIDHFGLSHYNGTDKSIPSTSEPTAALATDQNQDVPLAQPSTPKQAQQQKQEERQIVEVVQGIPFKPVEVESVDKTHPNIQSPTTSTHDAKTSLNVIPPASSHYTDDSAAPSLSTNRNVKARSTESYPGKFPVSEGLEFSSLATASCAFRERGTTSVRPFSDY
jgi:hypothetical protein